MRHVSHTGFSASPAVPAIAAQPRPCAFSYPDWIFEVIRALLYFDNDGVRLVAFANQQRR